MFQKNCLVFAKMGDCVKISIHATKPRQHGWQYRIRLKGNLIFQHEGGDITPMDGAKSKLNSMALLHESVFANN